MNGTIDDLFNDSGPRLTRGRGEDGRAITPERMSDQLAAELVEAIDSGDWSLNDWETDFIGDVLGRTTFSFKQKQVIYKLAKRFNLL